MKYCHTCDAELTVHNSASDTLCSQCANDRDHANAQNRTALLVIGLALLAAALSATVLTTLIPNG